MSEVLSWPLGCRHSQIAAVAAAVVAVVVVIAQLAGRGPSELTSGSAGLALSDFSQHTNISSQDRLSYWIIMHGLEINFVIHAWYVSISNWLVLFHRANEYGDECSIILMR